MKWVKWVDDNQAISGGWEFFVDSLKATAYLDSIEKAFIYKGYLALSTQQTSVGRDSTLVMFSLGRKYSWKRIDPGNVPGEVLNKAGELPEDYLDLDHWLDAIVRQAENIGYPFAQVKLDSILRKGDSLTATVNFKYGPLILWDSISVLGDTRTKAQYLQNITGIEPGTPFSQVQFEEASRLLVRSPYFALEGQPRVAFQIQKARPVFILKDRRSNVLDGIIGILPNENEPGKTLITGQLDLELYHLGGKGRDVAVHWQRLNLLSQSLDLSLKESYLFNSPLDIRVGFSLLKQDTTFLNRYLSLDFGYHLRKAGYVRFFTKRQSGDLLSTEAYKEITELPDVADFRWNQYGVGWEWNNLDSRFVPRRGFAVKGEFAAGNKRILQNTGIAEEIYLGMDLNSPQYEGRLEVERHFFFRPIWGMWLRGSGGTIQNRNLFLNDLSRLGGLKTIRGFNESFFFASSYAYINMEQRLFFGQNSFLMVFADAGILENPYFATQMDNPISFGAGLNLETGNGLFRFIYGVGKSNVQPLSFSYSRIHFGYLARF